MEKCAPPQDYKNVIGRIFEYLIASLPSSMPKNILCLLRSLIFCYMYKYLVERAAESEGPRRGVRDFYLGKRILAKEKCISTEKKEWEN